MKVGLDNLHAYTGSPSLLPNRIDTDTSRQQEGTAGGGKSQFINSFLNAGPWILILCPILVLTALPVDVRAQGAFAIASLIVLTALRFRPESRFSRTFSLVIILLIGLRYFFWRTFATLGYQDFWSFLGVLLLYSAELYGFGIFLFGLIVNVSPVSRKSPPVAWDDSRLPHVDVLVPSYNEDPEMLAVTLTAASQIRYPREKLSVYLLDDGGTVQKRNDTDATEAAAAMARHIELQQLCFRLGITYITRERNLHAKAGNINDALPKIHGDLILILDADHIPTADFLERTVGFFQRDPQLFLVQTPHFFVNADPIEKNLNTFEDMPGEGEMFYRVIQKGQDFWNAAFFCGSAGVLRRRFLDAIGGFSYQSITEDAETAMVLHSRGYRSAYLGHPMVAGLSPETFSAFVTQRTRWAQGMVQIFMLRNPMLLPGLSMWQRISYLSNCLFWFFPFARVIFLIAPTAYLFFGLKIYRANAAEVLAYSLPHFIASMGATEVIFGRVRWPFVSFIYEVMQSIFSLNVVLQTIRNPKMPKFKVTPKGERSDHDYVSPLAWPFYVVFFILTLAMAAGFYRIFFGHPQEAYVAVTVTLWNLLNYLLILAAMGALYERRQRRKTPRMPANLEGSLMLEDGTVIAGRVVNLSLGGACFTPFHWPPTIPLNTNMSLSIENRSLRSVSRFKVTLCNKADGLLSFAFDIQDERSFAEAVSLVYGDSERWKEFWDLRLKPAGMLRSLVILEWRGLLSLGRYLRQTAVNGMRLLSTSLAARVARWSLRLGCAPSKATASRILLALAPILTVLFCVSGAFAAVRPPAATVADAVRPLATEQKFQLQNFMTQPAPITLHGAYDRYEVSIPLASRLQVAAAKLHLELTNSTALVAGRSQLRILINGAVVAQLSLSSRQPVVSADISIPPALLKYGYNTLAFDAAQHYTDGCEDPRAPELWTQINAAQSTLEISGRLLPIKPKLSDLGELLGPAIGNTRHFLILMPSLPVDNDELGWGTLLAEAIGLHLHYVPAQFDAMVAKPANDMKATSATPELDESTIAGHDAILVGTRDHLRALLPPAVLSEITESFLAVYQLNTDPTHFLLVVSGETADQVSRAAGSLAIMNAPVLGASIARVNRTFIGQDAFFHRSNYLRPDHQYQFSDLGFRTKTASGSTPTRQSLDFTLPSDLYATELANVTLAFNFAYGANLRSDSVVNIYLNGEFNQAIRLDNPNGAVLRDYKLYIPLRDFRNGPNNLTFESALLAVNTSGRDNCQPSEANNLLFTLSDTSRLILPSAQNYAAQPNLDLFARAGFPYTNESLGLNTAVRVAGGDAETISAAYTLMAKLAQIADRAFPAADVAFAGSEAKRHVILIGAVSNIGSDLLKNAPLDFSHRLSLPYPTQSTASDDGPVAQTFLSRLESLYRRDQGPPDNERPANWVVGQARFGDAGVVQAFESPWASKRTMTVFTASAPEVLLHRVRELVDPAEWTQLAGDVSMLSEGQNTIFTERAGRIFHIGHLSQINLARYYLSAYPYFWIGSLLCLGLALTITVRIWSVRRRQRLFPRGSDAEV